MSLLFNRTMEISEFKLEFQVSSTLKVFTNTEKKPYFKFFSKRENKEIIYPVSQRTVLSEIKNDAVISECFDTENNVTIYMMHKRSENAHTLEFEM